MIPRRPDSTLNLRLRLLYAVLEDARCESTPAEWYELLDLLELRLTYLRHGRAAA